MSSRTFDSQPGNLEPLEHRLMLSRTVTSDEPLGVCQCSFCGGGVNKQASISDSARTTGGPTLLNPMAIRKGTPSSGNEPGALSGFVWLDTDADGRIDRYEGGLFNQTVFLDDNDNGVLDNGETSTVTNYAGYYVFKNLDAGTYNVAHEKWNRLTASDPLSSSQSVTLSGDTPVQDVNFGYYLSNPTVVDYLVVYTAETRRAAGGNDNIVDEINDMISTTNSAFVNSEIDIRLNLIAVKQVKYNETLQGIVDLDRLQKKGDGYFPEIHSMRNEYGADIATLIIENAFDVGGISIFPKESSSDPSSKGFNVVVRDVGISELVFAHELGHNFGAGHDLLTPANRGSFDYSHGTHIEVGNNQYRSIMAYPLEEGNINEKVLPFFSNPDLEYKNQPLGDADTADNSRTINHYAEFIANYRQRDQAGNDRASAYRFGNFPVGRTAVINDSVGDSDQFDVFKLKITEPTHFTARLFRLQRNAEMQLLEGRNVIESSRNTGKKNERIELDLDPGTYFVRVYNGSTGKSGTTYTLKLIAEEVEVSNQSQQRFASAAAASWFDRSGKDDASDSEKEEELALVDWV